MMLLVSLSLFVTPMAAKAGRAFAELWEQRHDESLVRINETVPEPVEGHVIIAGFGRVGQLIAEVLSEHGIRYIALENDARMVAQQRVKGFPVYFGNAARAELLNKVHTDRASAILLTMDHPVAALHAVKSIRREYPLVPVFARSRDEKHAIARKEAGASQVIPETLETGLRLSAFVLQTLGMSESSAARIVQIERDRRIAALRLDANV